MPQLLIGCGNSRARKISPDGKDWDGLVTIDHDPNCGADLVHDLDVLPWPVASDGFEEVHAYEVLEHLGNQGDFKSFFAHFAEIYRVLKPGGLLIATVPAWDSVWAWSDPSHRRIISRESLVFLDRTEYAKQIGVTPMTDFRWLWAGDFSLEASLTENGLFRFALKAHKPVRC